MIWVDEQRIYIKIINISDSKKLYDLINGKEVPIIDILVGD